MEIQKPYTDNFAERVHLNQQELAAELKSHYDFIICGAGSSGSVVAARLAAEPKIQVLLLEAGGTDETDLVTNPNRWPMTLGSELDWGFVAEPNPKLNGRAIRYSMGKVLGGGSSINVSTWSRGHRADWDFYASESHDGDSDEDDQDSDLIAIGISGMMAISPRSEATLAVGFSRM